MKTKILVALLIVTLIFSYLPTVYAAEEMTFNDIRISNVTSVALGLVFDHHESLSSSGEFRDSEAKTFYCDAPATITPAQGNQLGSLWYMRLEANSIAIENTLHTGDMSMTGKLIIGEGTYYFRAWYKTSTGSYTIPFYVVVGNPASSTSSPAASSNMSSSAAVSSEFPPAPEGYEYITIEGKYTRVNHFEDGMAAVAVGTGLVGVNDTTRWGFVDASGKLVIPLKYSNAGVPESASMDNLYYRFKDGMARVYVEGEGYTYINKQGVEIVPPGKYNWLYEFDNGFARVFKNGVGHGVINREGKEIIAPGSKYSSHVIPIADFSEGLILTCIDTYGVIDCATSAVHYGFLNGDGEVVIPFNFCRAEPFKDGLAYVRECGSKNFLINTKNEKVVSAPDGFLSREMIDDGFIRFTEWSTFGTIPGETAGTGIFGSDEHLGERQVVGLKDINGNIIVPATKYARIFSFNGEYAEVMQRVTIRNPNQADPSNNWSATVDEISYGVINRSGKETVALSPWWEIGTSEYGLTIAACFSERDKNFSPVNVQRGVIDLATGKFIIPAEYGYIGDDFINTGSGSGSFSEGMIRVVNKGGYASATMVGSITQTYGPSGFFNFAGEEVVPYGKYLDTSYYSEGKCAVISHDFKWGFVDKKGVEVVPLQYHSAGSFNEGRAPVGMYAGTINIETTSTPADVWERRWLVDKNYIAPTPASLPTASEEKPSSWAEQQVNAAISANIVPTSLQSKYTQATTRAEFCSLVVAAYEKLNGEITGRVQFNDTTDVNVEKAAFIGVVSGTNTELKLFTPESPLSREMAAVMLARLADALGKPFPEQASTATDIDSFAIWSAEAIGQIQAAGIMSSTSTTDNVFSPQVPYSREMSIVTILRLHNMLA